MNTYQISVAGKTYQVEIEVLPSKGSPARAIAELVYRVRLDGREIAIDCLPLDGGTLSLIVNGESFDIRCLRTAESLQVVVRGAVFECVVRDPRSLRNRKRAGVVDSGEQKLTASMPGKVVRIIASVGDQISAGQGIIVIEAMKMQNEVRSPRNGKLMKLLVGQGDNVGAGEVLAMIE